ncbi:IscS subfamily cysteine desulfurase [Bacillus sp. PS06]|uniref:IscS subfamily cysteine desulfurase n=1 Tax=Bacillus sp. PS06 TaxID=2764176 RepID=UPI00177CB353|nr:IscS subfamily cysteine desulfurase [Bacillus sp. PS06]MBD8069337.1 IscS subfamily cysteine desulfurase [Bacillus sp. PS06]
MMIYLDYAATTPMSEQAIEVYSEVAKNVFGNTSSLHDIGTKANSLLEHARAELASCINGMKDGVYFTSGGTESNHLILETIIRSYQGKGNHIITTKIEHSSIINFFNKLEQVGYEITYLPVDTNGKVNIADLEQAIKPTTILASIHHGNSEIGVIQDLEAIGKLLKEHSIIFHSDCVQTFGKHPIDVVQLNLDAISISSHKIYGPKGVGAAFLHPAVHWKPIYPNTTHENGFRPGTINLPGIAAFVTAAQQICEQMEFTQNNYKELREHLKQGLTSLEDNIDIIENSTHQLPHIVGLCIKGIEGQYMMLECNRYGLAISTGSACAVGQQSPSKTMLAMGKTREEAKQFIRLSFGKSTTFEIIDQVITIFKNSVIVK